VNDAKLIAAFLFIIAVFGLSIWWQVYAYQDCKAVGHSTLYCVLRIGK